MIVDLTNSRLVPLITLALFINTTHEKTMKYLEDEKLTELTSELTEAVLGGTSCRVLNGRIEAFTMKRAGTDKKYAHALGERYVAEMEEVEQKLATYQHLVQTHHLPPSLEPPGKPTRSSSSAPSSPPREARKRSQSVGFNLDRVKPAKQARVRASSFDSSTSGTGAVLANSSALGDFQETGTRRLMTDLILTLNASFPDYDFGDVRPSHFTNVPLSLAVRRINERLSELAAQKGEDEFRSKLWNAVDGVIGLSEAAVVYSFAPSARDDDSFLAQTLVEDEATPLWSFNYFFVNKARKRILLFYCVETMLNEDDAHVEEVEVEEYVSKALGYSTDTAGDVDFDIDPSADVAGGIPLVTSS